MSQKLQVNGFKWVKNPSQLNEDFIKSYNGESHKGYLLEVDVQHPEELHELHNDFPFLTERMNIVEFGKLVAKFHDKKECFIHTRNLEQALNYG